VVTRPRKVGVVAEPVDGPAQTRFAEVDPTAAWTRLGMSAVAKERNEGIPALPFGEAKTRLALWLFRVPVSVPLLVTGLFDTVNTEVGRESPTELTVPATPPSPTSPELVQATICPEVPALLAVTTLVAVPVVFMPRATVPEVVTGDPVTVMVLGTVTPTLVTVPCWQAVEVTVNAPPVPA
jgi:hypothetical protein